MVRVRLLKDDGGERRLQLGLGIFSWVTQISFGNIIPRTKFVTIDPVERPRNSGFSTFISGNLCPKNIPSKFNYTFFTQFFFLHEKIYIFLH